MKILHTSDWHLGQRFYGYDRLEEHESFMTQLARLIECEKPDAMLVSGDIFDSALPSAQVQKFFVDSVLALKRACGSMEIFITAGNHDSGARLEVMKPLWESHGVHLVGGSRRDEDGNIALGQFIFKVPAGAYVVAVPYFHPMNFPAAEEVLERSGRQAAFFRRLSQEVADLNVEGWPVIVMAHLGVAGCDLRGHDERLIGNIEFSAPEQLGYGYDYLALGHIHKAQNVAAGGAVRDTAAGGAVDGTVDGIGSCQEARGLVRYSGSPLPLSFAEDFPHSVTLVEIERHGAPLMVREEEIQPLRGVLTLPREAGGDLEAALEELSRLPSEDNSYIRLLVTQDVPVPADAEQRALKCIQDGNKACRLCEIRRKVRLRSSAVAAGSPADITDMEEVRMLDPMEIAGRHYLKKNQEEMNGELKELLRQAVESVKAGQA